MALGVLNLTQIQQSLQLIVTAINNLVVKLGTVFVTTGAVTHSATGGGDTLPAAPVGFLTITLPDGSVKKLPLYDE